MKLNTIHTMTESSELKRYVNAAPFVPLQEQQENEYFDKLEKQWWESNKAMFEEAEKVNGI
jgi:hypothetical protein